MIRKTSNTYKQIKLNIGMLTLIQQATGISLTAWQTYLSRTFLSRTCEKKTKDEYWTTELLSNESAYKYFKRASKAYLNKVESNPNYETL